MTDSDILEVRDIWFAAYAIANGNRLLGIATDAHGFTRYKFDGLKIQQAYLDWTSPEPAIKVRPFLSAYRYLRDVARPRLAQPNTTL